MSDDEPLMLTFVGAPEEFFRAVEPKYAEQARHDAEGYLRRTLSFNQHSGGRYYAPGEFGALYTGSDEPTAWAELHARFTRQGVRGLPPMMGLLRLTVRSGQYVDVRRPAVREVWEVALDTLQAETPTDEQQAACWSLGRDVRTVADFLTAPSARADGDNVPLFIAGREDTDFTVEIIGVDTARPTPIELRLPARELWD